MSKEKIIFMGTADFSSAVLKMLLEEEYLVIAVVTQPDRKVGRKKIITPSLVKQLALQHNIEVIQPENIGKEYQRIVELQPDLIITAAYGQFVPKTVLDLPRLGCINVHASLLPKYRGGAPVHYAIINGEKETGVTIMYMAQKMDAGDMIANVVVPIENTEIVGTLYTKLTIAGAELLKRELPSILEGKNQRIKQNEADATFAYAIQREEEMINWNQTTWQVDCFIRGLNPWPVASTTYQGTNIKLFAGKIHDCLNAKAHHLDAKPGEIVKLFKDGIAIKVQDGIYIVEEIQIAGKRRMSVKQVLNGNPNYFKVGTVFED